MQHCRNCKQVRRPDSFLYKFVCYSCNYNSYLTSNMKKHVQIHLGEKPYKCNSCPYGSVQKHCLDSHMSRFHWMLLCIFKYVPFQSIPNLTFTFCITSNNFRVFFIKCKKDMCLSLIPSSSYKRSFGLNPQFGLKFKVIFTTIKGSFTSKSLCIVYI